MAEPIPFPESNFTFTAPKGDKTCTELPVYKDATATLSKWKLTTKEIEEVNRTGEVWLWVWLWVWGHSMFPVAIVAESPFKKPAPEGTTDVV